MLCSGINLLLQFDDEKIGPFVVHAIVIRLILVSARGVIYSSKFAFVTLKKLWQ